MRVALIGPRFFSYLEALSAECQRKGIFATTEDDIHSRTLFWRIVYRLRLSSLYMGKLKAHNRRLISQFKEQGITHVIFVNCETYDEDFLQSCEAAGIRLTVYFWDSIANKPIFSRYISRFKHVASFDPGDCEEHGLTYIPLFAERELFVSEASKPRAFDASMVATIHSSRADWASEMRRLGGTGNYRIKLFAYFSSKWLFVVKNLFNPTALGLLGALSTKPMSKQEIAELSQSSRHVVDVHHHKQRGLTSRTFESLAAGAFLITTNSDVALLPDSLRSRTRVVSTPSELAGVLSQPHDVAPLSADERYFLSIERFVDELLAHAGHVTDKRPPTENVAMAVVRAR